MKLKIGELCAGYGGLGLAVEEVFDAELAWVSEFEEAPSKILAHHWPDVPNHGDMTKIDWAAIEPVDIISGGTPCQDLSHAGRRAGMTDGTRSNLWVQMREAIATIRPMYVVWENVRGAYSAEADSSLEQCPGCMGDPTNGRVFLRALGRVLGDLSDLGYDCQWRGLRAADVGAPHGRFRVFILATHRDSQGLEIVRNGSGVPGAGAVVGATTVRNHPYAANAHRIGRERAGEARHGRAGFADGSQPAPDPSCTAVREHSGEPPTEEAWAAGGDRSGHLGGERLAGDRRQAPANSKGERRDDGHAGDIGQARRGIHLPLDSGNAAAGASGTPETNWGEYEPAIRRWESTLGRRAPAPTEPTGRNGGHRLSARFAEWMMGVPDGWIVDVPGISRNEALKAAGNGVVPQQAAAALRHMLNHSQRKEVT